MNTDIIIGVLIIVIVLGGLTLPLTYLSFKFLQGVIELMKELKNDYAEISQEFQQEELETYFQRQQEKVQLGYMRYYRNQIRFFFRNYGIWLYAFASIVALASLYFLHGMPDELEIPFSGVKNPNVAALLFLPIQIVAFFGYLCCKQDKRKWQFSFALFILFFLELVWGIVIEKSPMQFRTIFLILLTLISFKHYYERWKKSSNENLFVLQQQLKENYITNDALLNQYMALQEQRHDTKKHLTMLQYLAQEQELEAMQSYLKQTEKQQGSVQVDDTEKE